jgi:hypothetical protein
VVRKGMVSDDQCVIHGLDCIRYGAKAQMIFTLTTG